MRYQGSKKRIAKDIAKIVERVISPDDWYIEPFIGGANSFSVIDHAKKIGNDINSDVIAMWNAVKDGTFTPPESVSLEEYYDMKDSVQSGDNRYNRALIGYVSHSCSNGSGYFTGYAHFNPKRGENHIAEAARSFNKQVSEFKHLETSAFTSTSYSEMVIPSNSFVYCDPPYANTKKYSCGFDNDKFWEWCRNIIKTGAKVMVSEYAAPDDFVCIWRKTVKDGMSNKLTDGKQADKIEKLFVHKSQINLFFR